MVDKLSQIYKISNMKMKRDPRGAYPDKQKRATVLALREAGHPFSVIAEIMGTSRQAAHQMYHRAKQEKQHQNA